MNSDAFEDYVFGKIKRYGFRSEAEERDAPAAPNNVERGPDGVRMPGHLEHYVDAEASRFFSDYAANIFLGRIEREIGFHLRRELTPVLVDFYREDGGCTDGSGHSYREQSDGTTAGHSHTFCGDFSGGAPRD